MNHKYLLIVILVLSCFAIGVYAGRQHHGADEITVSATELETFGGIQFNSDGTLHRESYMQYIQATLDRTVRSHPVPDTRSLALGLAVDISNKTARVRWLDEPGANILLMAQVVEDQDGAKAIEVNFDAHQFRLQQFREVYPEESVFEQVAEDWLLAVLLHEYAHIMWGHTTERMTLGDPRHLMREAEAWAITTQMVIVPGRKVGRYSYPIGSEYVVAERVYALSNGNAQNLDAWEMFIFWLHNGISDEQLHAYLRELE